MPLAPLLIELPENTRGRDFVVADLHGHLPLLDRALAARGFDRTCDRVLAVGDLIDRGPASADVLALLAEPWFASVRGNHEQALLDWIDALLEERPAAEVRTLAGRHFGIGGDWATSLLTAAQRHGKETLRPWQQALAALPFALATRAHGASIGVVHACVPGGDWQFFRQTSAETQALHRVLWHRHPHEEAPVGVRGIDLVFAGHNQVPAVHRIGNFRMIETAAWAGNELTLIELDPALCAQPGNAATPNRSPRRWLPGPWLQKPDRRFRPGP